MIEFDENALSLDNEDYIRIKVDSGGCSGFSYGSSFDNEINEDDNIYHDKFVIDNLSEEILDGSKVNYIKSLEGSYFSIDIPNAKNSCGCGSSFSL